MRTAAPTPITRSGVGAAVVLAVVVLVSWGTAGAALGASGWAVRAGTTTAVAASVPLAPPTGVTAACADPLVSRTATVSWNAVPHATYTVYQATAATGPFTVAASGLAATSWTSGALKTRTTYWFEVSATVGGAWTSAVSAPTAGLTMANKSPFCA